MRRSGRHGSIASNPALVGGVTALVVVVATFLAYNANAGLPFVPTYKVALLLPNVDGLGRGADVRVGGTRVGRVSAIAPASRPGRTPVARVELEVNRSLDPLPADTIARVRPVSALGARFLELDLGRSRRALPRGQPLPVRQGRTAVDIDEVLGTFDRGTRGDLRRVTTQLGNGLAARGPDLNAAIAAAPELAATAEPVLANLASPRTGLARFVRGALATTEALSPQADRLGALLDHAAQTFGGIEAARHSVDALLRDAPASEAALTRDLPDVRGTLADARALLVAVRPAAERLPGASTRVAGLLGAARPVLRATPAATRRLTLLGAPLHALVARAPALSAVRALTGGLESLHPTLAFANPMQVRCNYLGLWSRNVPDLLSEGDRNGTWFRYLLMVKPDEMLHRPDPSVDAHTDPYPQTGQDGECEAGNEAYSGATRIGSTPAREPGATEATSPPQDGGR